MIKYIIIGTIITLLGMLSSGDGIIIVLGSMIIIPFIMVVQLAVYSLCKLLRFNKQISYYSSLVPSIAFSIFALLNLSVFFQATNIFETVMQSDKPDSVTELYAWEESWTDYMAELYCEISPEDLKKLIKDLGVKQDSSSAKFYKEISLKDSRMEAVRKKAPIKDLVVYSSSVDDENDWVMHLTIYTNKEHNRVFAMYGVN